MYSADGSFKQNKKKRFAGHTVAGYACGIGFSPDGKYLSSGTGSGDVVFWDWKTGKIAKRLRAHDQVVIDHVWLPNEHVSVPGTMPAVEADIVTVQGCNGIVGWSDQAMDLRCILYRLRVFKLPCRTCALRCPCLDSLKQSSNGLGVSESHVIYTSSCRVYACVNQNIHHRK